MFARITELNLTGNAIENLLCLIGNRIITRAINQASWLRVVTQGSDGALITWCWCVCINKTLAWSQSLQYPITHGVKQKHRWMKELPTHPDTFGHVGLRSDRWDERFSHAPVVKVRLSYRAVTWMENLKNENDTFSKPRVLKQKSCFFFSLSHFSPSPKNWINSSMFLYLPDYNVLLLSVYLTSIKN